jgi:3-ketosteroid 9alpha-monooxygenase subunit B
MSAEVESSMSAGPYHPLKVTRVIEETHDTRSVILEIPAELQALFAYRAGQFLTFRVAVDDDHLVRCYSLASSPDTESEHKVTIKRVPDGRVSNWFHDGLSAGDSLNVMKPAGHFVIQQNTGPIVLFGGGSGITPIIAIIKTALATTARTIRLVYANRDQASIIFRAELDTLVAAHPDRLDIQHRLDDREGFLDVPAARTFIADRPDADFYVCGPGPYMDVVEAALAEASIAAEHIFIERFVVDEQQPAAVPSEAPSGSTGLQVEIHLDGNVHTVDVEAGETILSAAHRVGLDAPCACMEGYCGACMAKLTEGDAEMILNDGGIDAREEAQGWILTCQALPKSARVCIRYPEPD